MKNLPDKFPIRYAIVTYDLDALEFDDPKLKAAYLKDKESLFIQYVSKLQTGNDLSSGYYNIGLNYLNEEILNVKSLKYDYPYKGEDFLKIIENIKQELCKFLVVDKKDIRDFWGNGNAFDAFLYSYTGSGERPAFLISYENILKKKVDFDFYVYKGTIKIFYDLYEKIRQGKLSGIELNEKLIKYDKPIFINTYYSKKWEYADKGKTNGLFKPRLTDHELIDKINEADETLSDRKINVAVCRSWEELFAEEIRQIYNISSFCNNCGKALPFDYQGKYCPPDLTENAECVKERARKRAKKGSQN